MKYVLDTEFIDTSTCSALISLALVREDGAYRYLEFDYPAEEITPWLRQNVTPHLSGYTISFMQAQRIIAQFMHKDSPEFWCYFGAYDWYWFCRLFGGLMALPSHWPHRYREFADIQSGVPAVAGPEHNALNDARAILAAMKLKGLA